MRAWLSAGTLVTLVALATGVSAQGDSPYRLEGTVVEEGTLLPVAGATVEVLVESNPPDERAVHAKSDERGRYSLPLPIGHAVTWRLLPPAGFVPVKNYVNEPLATTVEHPVVTKDYQVRRGVAWTVALGGKKPSPLPKTHVSGLQRLGDQYLSAYCELDADGRGVLTLADVGGEFTIGCGDFERTIRAPTDMKLTVETGFRSDAVAALNKLEGSATEIVDRNGRKARLERIDASIADANATLTIDVEPAPDTERLTITGRVVDSADKPIAGAKLEASFHSGGGSAMTSFVTNSNEDGAFRLPVNLSNPELSVGLVVTKEGYAGVDTPPLKPDLSKSREADAGTIKLVDDSSIPLRVVGPDGQPLAGALVEPQNSYAARSRITRTDLAGMCLLDGLPAGTPRVYARFGNLIASTALPLKQGNNELLTLKLNPSPAARAVPDKLHGSLAIGTDAPEWDISQWSDGKPRKLADFRGKVVVLDFWGTWCGPCVRMLPVMKQLEERFADRDVVLLGIHSAGTDMSLIRRFLEQNNCPLPTGLDAGGDKVHGATVLAYAVNLYPTLMIVDREGKIAFNTEIAPSDRDAHLAEMERVAKAAGFPWPLDKDATPDEVQERLNQLWFAIYSREIERVLKAEK